MTDSKIETTKYSTTAILERRASPVTFTDDVFQSKNLELIAQSQYGTGSYERRHSDTVENALIPSSNSAIDQLVNQNMVINSNDYPINQDANPEHVRRQNNERITYRQDVAIRYLQPPTPPPPAPVIIREIRAPQPPEAPPLVIRQRPPNPVTPPPIVIRERPPAPPAIEPPRIVTKYLPAPPPPPRKVIIERQTALPQKPQPIIIEKWLPYKPSAERRVVVERAPALVQTSTQRNTVITYDAPQVDLVKNIRDLGVVRADPQTYSVQYGSQLTSSEYVLNTMAKFGLGNNYSQMIQMQTSPRPSTSSHQSVTYDERSAHQLHNGDYSEYIERHVEEIASPNNYRKVHSSNSSTNEYDVSRYTEVYN